MPELLVVVCCGAACCCWVAVCGAAPPAELWGAAACVWTLPVDPELDGAGVAVPVEPAAVVVGVVVVEVVDVVDVAPPVSVAVVPVGTVRTGVVCGTGTSTDAPPHAVRPKPDAAASATISAPRAARVDGRSADSR